eukprot:m.21959 g.21959  ORF g.21959 m.21959 type:complete len:829 (-) comp3946_c0_seq1:108-2594(-)
MEPLHHVDPFAGASDFLSHFPPVGSAATEGQLRAFWSTTLHVVVSEAKNVVKESDNNNFYCQLAVDDEVVARTSVVWRASASPFFGEEFFIECRHNMQSLRVYIHTAEKHDPVGVVNFHRSMFEGPRPLDGWFPLAKPTPQTEPHGEVLVAFLLSHPPRATRIHLTVSVLAGRDLAPKDSTARVDPHVVIVLDNERQSTNRAKGMRYPRWDTTFTFERARLPPSALIQLYDGGTLIGEAKADLAGIHPDIPLQEWYRMMPSEAALDKFQAGQGSIRMRAKYSKELILPYPCYLSLVELLQVDGSTPEGIQHGLISLLEGLLMDPNYRYTDREHVARMLVRTMLYRHQSITFLSTLNGVEIANCKNASSLFRGNTLATKCTDQFMKMVGLPYLHDTLKPAIDVVFREKKNCEIDPYLLSRKSSKGGNSADPTTQVGVLTRYLNMIFESIFSSVERCPPLMRAVFKSLRQDASKNDALPGDTAFTVVSGFLFLRFFAPAVLSPKLFGMREELADATTARTLTLLAKALMSVGNLGASMDSGKAEYMKPLYPVIRKHLAQLKKFIDELCDITLPPDAESTLARRKTSSSYTTATTDMSIQGEISAKVVHQDTALLSRTMRKRWFTLTPSILRVSKSRVRSAGGSEDEEYQTDQFSVVERLEAGAVDKRHAIMIEVEGVDTIVLGFSNKSELDKWLLALRQATATASGQAPAARHRPEAYYPYLPKTTSRKRGWTAPCAKCHGSVLIDPIADNQPAEVWAHKLFLTLLEGKELLEKRYPIDDGDDGEDEEAGGGGDDGEDTHDVHPRTRATLTQLYSILDDIHLAHLLHQDH